MTGPGALIENRPERLPSPRVGDWSYRLVLQRKRWPAALWTFATTGRARYRTARRLQADRVTALAYAWVTSRSVARFETDRG